LVYFPDLSTTDAEKAYPLMIREFLPTGLRGLMVASLMAAFMSTMETQLNWGASYLINDLYKRFIVKEASTKHYVLASRVSVLLLTALGALTAWQSETITGAWIYLMTLTAGAGMVGLLRWYWWRINAWSEISALLGSFIIANGNIWALPFRSMGLIPARWGNSIDWFYGSEAYAVRTLVIVGVCTLLWVSVTFLTTPVSDEHLKNFFRRVRPGGWWGRIAKACPEVKRDRARYGWIGWASGVVSIYASLFGVGSICLNRPFAAAIYLPIAAVSGWYMVTHASAIGQRS
jgi:SSS family solute:Na+ symporter